MASQLRESLRDISVRTYTHMHLFGRPAPQNRWFSFQLPLSTKKRRRYPQKNTPICTYIYIYVDVYIYIYIYLSRFIHLQTYIYIYPEIIKAALHKPPQKEKPFKPGQTTQKAGKKCHILKNPEHAPGASDPKFFLWDPVKFDRIPSVLQVPRGSVKAMGGPGPHGQRTCFSQAQTVSIKLSPSQAHLYSVARAHFGAHPCRSAPHCQLLCSANLVLI